MLYTHPHPVRNIWGGGAGTNVPTSVDSGDAKCVLFAHELVGSLLTFPGEATVSELVALEALMRPSVRAVENCKGKARQATDVDFIRSKTPGSRTDRVVVSKLDMEKVYVPLVLVVVANHGEHLRHRMVDEGSRVEIKTVGFRSMVHISRGVRVLTLL